MTALVFAPPPWHYYAFPLVVQWQAPYEALGFYFPERAVRALWKTSPDNKFHQPAATAPAAIVCRPASATIIPAS